MAEAKGLIFDGIEEATEEEIAMYATLVSPPPAALVAKAAVLPVKAKVPKKPTAGKTMFGVALSAASGAAPAPAAPAAPAAKAAKEAKAPGEKAPAAAQAQDPAKFGEFAKLAEGIQTTSYSDQNPPRLSTTNPQGLQQLPENTRARQGARLRCL